MDYSVFDIEGDSLTPKKIHCLCYTRFVDGLPPQSNSITDYQEMRDFIAGETNLVGHNVIRFDIPVLKRLLGIEIKARIVDTLALSWYVSPERLKHGLDEWGQYFGIEKPPITDWENLPVEEYIYRCSEDVRINVQLFQSQLDYLFNLYEGNSSQVTRIMQYLMFKMDCAYEQEQIRWKLDVIKTQDNLSVLRKEQEDKIKVLSEAMPPVVMTKTYTYPDEKLFKKDGNLSAKAKDWYYLLGTQGLPVDHIEPVTVELSRQLGNPNSGPQIKSWLYSLGWVPDVFKYDKNEATGEVRPIPQINKIYPDEGVSDSIMNLVDKEPAIEALDKLSIINHRIGILKGFLENVSPDGYLQAKISGFTNTLRFKHTEIVNLPTIHKPYGEMVRGVLTCPEGKILCGTDMSGLEDNTKQHYMYFYDPEYVKEMRTEGFDPHLDIALLAGMLTAEEVAEHKTGTKKHTKVRLDAKKVNFTATYGAGPPKIAITANMPLDKAQLLHRVYWVRNRAIKSIARDVKTKRIGKQMWLYNPVSHFWYSLRVEKDKFSTLNQGTGVYCFDNYMRFNRQKDLKACGQFHDEGVLLIDDNEEVKAETKLKLEESIKQVNDLLKLNIELSISIDFGYYYSEIH